MEWIKGTSIPEYGTPFMQASPHRPKAELLHKGLHGYRHSVAFAWNADLHPHCILHVSSSASSWFNLFCRWHKVNDTRSTLSSKSDFHNS